MKRKRSIVDSRRDSILDELKTTGEIKAELLAAKYQVTPLTIRRDLQWLESNNKIQRFYGGAVLAENEKIEGNELDEYRRLIAKHAAGLVEDGDTIFINTSMTALQIVGFLENKRVTVITNNGRIFASKIPESVQVLITGGELRYPKFAMIGEFAQRNLEKVTVKKSFLGCSGLTEERGMTTEIMNEVPINMMMMKNVAGAAYILADHTKVGINSSFISARINNITHIITDEKAPKEELKKLGKHNIEIFQVKIQ